MVDWSMIGAQPQSCLDAFALPRLVGATEDGPRADDETMFVGLWEELNSVSSQVGAVFVAARLLDDADAAADFLGDVDAAAAACPTGYAFSDPFTGEPSWASTGITVTEFPGTPDAVTSRVLTETPAAGINKAERTVFLQHENVVISIDVRTTPAAKFTIADLDPLVLTIAERLVAL